MRTNMKNLNNQKYNSVQVQKFLSLLKIASSNLNIIQLINKQIFLGSNKIIAMNSAQQYSYDGYSQMNLGEHRRNRGVDQLRDYENNFGRVENNNFSQAVTKFGSIKKNKATLNNIKSKMPEIEKTHNEIPSKISNSNSPNKRTMHQKNYELTSRAHEGKYRDSEQLMKTVTKNRFLESIDRQKQSITHLNTNKHSQFHILTQNSQKYEVYNSKQAKADIRKDKVEQQRQLKKYFNNQSDEQDGDIQGQQIEIGWKNSHFNQANSRKIAQKLNTDTHKEKGLQKNNKNMNSEKKTADIFQRYGKKSAQNITHKKYEERQFQDEDQFNYQKYQHVDEKSKVKVNKNLKSEKLSQQNNRGFSYKSNTQSKHSFKSNANSKILDSAGQNSISQSNKNQFQQFSNSNNTKYGPGGVTTLEFNKDRQKIVILDSKETERLNVKAANLVQDFCDNFDIPPLESLPTIQNTPQQLVSIAKDCFIKFSCKINDQTVISVKKYRNCVHFSISPQNNILYHYDNGKLYYGAWKTLRTGEGQKHGEGIEIVPGKYKFKGFFIQGKKSGLGTLINFNGSAYVGQWQNGMKHGQGKQLDCDGLIYQGQWKQGKRNGYGKLINQRRVEFEGVFIKGLKNGYGKQYFENGDIYDGNYVNNKFHGQGTYAWKNGAIYTGQFKAGKRNGFGIWKSSSNNFDSYEGQYVEDMKHGKGIYKWRSGAIYQGEFEDDLKHGQGKLTYENGKVAILSWKKGKVQKKISEDQVEEEGKNFHQLSDRNFEKGRYQILTGSESQIKAKTNFILRNRPSSRSTQNLMATGNKTKSSQNLKGVTFNTKVKTSEKNFKQTKKDGQKIIRLKFDNNQFEKAIGKDWKLKANRQASKNSNEKKQPEFPRDRPYQGIQMTTNDMNF